MLIPRASTLLALLVTASGCRPAPVVSTPKMTLHCTLTALVPATAGSPLRVRWEVANEGSAAVSVLTWQTPLEGFLGPDFAITRDGVEVAYRGAVVKRGDPVAESYVRLPAGGAVSREVDLAEAYDVSAPGRYLITFPGGLVDGVPDGVAVPRTRDHLVPVALDCPPVEVTRAP